MIDYKMAVVQLAAYYEKDLSDEQILMYAKQLSQFLTIGELAQATEAYINNPENEFFPRPVSKLIALIKKPVENRDQAQNVLSLLKNAIHKHGDNWSDGHFVDYEMVFSGKGTNYRSWAQAAETVVGSLGLAIIQKSGGWKHFCRFYYEQPEGVFNAHIAKLSEAVLNIADAGHLQTLPALPGAENNILKLINIKTLAPPAGDNKKSS